MTSFYPVSFYTTLLSLPSKVSFPAISKVACLYCSFTFSYFIMMNIACKKLKAPVIPFPWAFHVANFFLFYFFLSCQLFSNLSTTVRWKFTLSHPLIHWYHRSHPLLYCFKPHEHQMPWFLILVTYLWFFSS